MATNQTEFENVGTNENLMDCIRQYLVIYDKSCKGYKVPQNKKNALLEIFQKLGLSVDEAQTRYKSIRTNLSKYARRLKFSRFGSGRNDLPEIREVF